MRWLLILSALVLPHHGRAQLLVHRAIDLGTRVAGEVVRCSAADCGEVLRAAPQTPGGVYAAGVTALPLERVGGQASLTVTPSVACLHVWGGPSCTAVQVERSLHWGIGVEIHLPPGVLPGSYRGAVTILVTGPRGGQSLRVPVVLHVRATEPACTLSHEGRLHFGNVRAAQAGRITLDPSTGMRTGAEGQYAGSSVYSMPVIRLATMAPQALIAVTPSDLLRASGGALPFTSLLAVRQGPSYDLTIAGAGSAVLAPGHHRLLTLRLGGRIDVPSAAVPGSYRGTVQIRYHCY